MKMTINRQVHVVVYNAKVYQRVDVANQACPSWFAMLPDLTPSEVCSNEKHFELEKAYCAMFAEAVG